MIATLILSAALSHGDVIHYQHDYPDVAACESAFSIANRQLKEVGAKTIRGECLTESSVKPAHQKLHPHHRPFRKHQKHTT